MLYGIFFFHGLFITPRLCELATVLIALPEAMFPVVDPSENLDVIYAAPLGLLLPMKPLLPASMVVAFLALINGDYF